MMLGNSTVYTYMWLCVQYVEYMYVRMYVCMYVYTYVCIYVMYVSMYACMLYKLCTIYS
jgi:hypothetical protein